MSTLPTIPPFRITCLDDQLEISATAAEGSSAYLQLRAFHRSAASVDANDFRAVVDGVRVPLAVAESLAKGILDAKQASGIYANP